MAVWPAIITHERGRRIGKRTFSKTNGDLSEPLIRFDWRQLDESGRIVYGSEDAVKPATPAPGEEEAPFWDGWSADGLGLNGEEVSSLVISSFRRRVVYVTEIVAVDLPVRDTASLR